MLKTVSAIATQIISSITGGLVQFTGPAAGTTRVITVPDANATMARTDAAQSFTGDQTLGTGNLIQGTAAKGVNFTANTPAAGMTSQLLNWYEEGTWTPTDGSGAGLSLTVNSARYTRVGRVVTVQVKVTYPATASAVGAAIGGFPFAPSSECSGSYYSGVAAGATYYVSGVMYIANSVGGAVTNATLSGAALIFNMTYSV